MTFFSFFHTIETVTTKKRPPKKKCLCHMQRELLLPCDYAGNRDCNVASTCQITPVDNMIDNSFPCSNMRSKTQHEMLLTSSVGPASSIPSGSSMTTSVTSDNCYVPCDSTSSENDTDSDSDGISSSTSGSMNDTKIDSDSNSDITSSDGNETVSISDDASNKSRSNGNNMVSCNFDASNKSSSNGNDTVSINDDASNKSSSNGNNTVSINDDAGNKSSSDGNDMVSGNDDASNSDSSANESDKLSLAETKSNKNIKDKGDVYHTAFVANHTSTHVVSTDEHGLSLPIDDIDMLNGIHDIHITSNEINKTTDNNNSTNVSVPDPAMPLTYSIDFDNNDDSIIQAVTQLVAASVQVIIL